MKTALSLFAFIVAPVSALIGTAVYDRSETTLRYTVGTTWGGDKAVFQYEDGRLFRSNQAETVGLFAYGRPRLVAFDCDGTDSPLIAMEEDELPRCGRIEAISDTIPAARWAA